MLFNSLDFAIFLPIVFLLYWFAVKRNFKFQNLVILVSSYVFYGWWDYRFLSLIIFSTLVDYLVGIALSKEEGKLKRKLLLWTSIFVNLGFLAFFKYYNFFLDNFISAFSLFGMKVNANSLNIILPVGISFYTFQSLSYTIDVYRRKLTPTKDIVAFSAFISFFPQIVAGPIERATNLLPQFYKKRTFDYSEAVDGMRHILWGLLKKIVIANNCAVYANEIFNNSADYSGSTLALGALFFTFQIYADFSGYSDIAIGTSKLFGFNLKQNFASPYFSRNIGEFWRRWHISLSSWFRDYVYIPLGGSRAGTFKKVRNTFVVFIVCAFWHGANWTFIAWGVLNAIYFLPTLLNNKRHKHLHVVAEGKLLPTLKEASQMLFTFGLTVLAWIFFRAENITHAFTYITSLLSDLFKVDSCVESYNYLARIGYPFIIITLIFIVIEWLGRKEQFAIQGIDKHSNKLSRLILYYLIFTAIYAMGGEEQQFIYFQF